AKPNPARRPLWHRRPAPEGRAVKGNPLGHRRADQQRRRPALGPRKGGGPAARKPRAGRIRRPGDRPHQAGQVGAPGRDVDARQRSRRRPARGRGGRRGQGVRQERNGLARPRQARRAGARRV
ncbi:MAG: hypothetical protein AVDCRST_MAG64-2886, partial [uncultured Phycisphaerae bacterium]